MNKVSVLIQLNETNEIIAVDYKDDMEYEKYWKNFVYNTHDKEDYDPEVDAIFDDSNDEYLLIQCRTVSDMVLVAYAIGGMNNY